MILCPDHPSYPGSELYLVIDVRRQTFDSGTVWTPILMFAS